MGVNGVTNTDKAYIGNGSASKVKTEQTTETKNKSEDTAVIYEKSEQSSESKKANKVDNATVEKLKAEAEKRSQSLRSLVEKMLLKQGQTISDATDIYALLREGKVEVDPKTSEQAKKDIAEDGYWGVEQTSDRILSFAKALAGNDRSKADELIEAVKKGFDEATKSWGDELPDLCKDTLDTAIKKLEAWRDGTDNDSLSDMTANSFLSQASANAIAKS